MATDTPHRPDSHELAALRDFLKDVPVAVYSPAHGLVFKCPNPWHPTDVGCDRERDFTVLEAQQLADRIHTSGLGRVPPGSHPIVLAYGIPWSP